MNSSVRQSLRCRAIYASDLLFLRKKSLAAPIHQNCLLLLSTLKKPADQPLHVSTSVENLKFKCETAAMSTVMEKKNITGVYLATRWAVPNLVYQQLNALALTPYSTLSIMTLNLSPGKAGYAKWASIWPPSTIEVVNNSDRDIDKISIEKKTGKHSICVDLKAGNKEVINTEEIEECVRLKALVKVIVCAGSEEIEIVAQAFTCYKKLVFYTNAKKLDWKGTS